MVWSAGGSIGELKGNRIRITIRYMGGYRQAPQPSATDVNRSVAILPGPVYHEAVIERFVRKNEPSSLLFNAPCNQLLRQHFQEIERVEIQLQVMKDR